MRAFRVCSGFAAGLFALLVTAADARAETFDLEVARLGPSYRTSTSTADGVFRSRYYQRFYMRTDPSGRSVRDADEADFSKVVVKEPDYASEHPFRGVATLGTEQFGFVLDTHPAKSVEDDEDDSEKSRSVMRRERYTRLFFDLNHNGDLTDDEVTEAEEASSSSYSYFPRVDLTVDADGTELDYAFYLRASSSVSSVSRYVRAYLYGAAYRHGEITVDGQKKRIVLVDDNSNGRFDDELAFDPNVRYSDGTVYARPGDMVYLDPDPSNRSYDVTTNENQHYVSKLIGINGRFYDVKISPAGDKLTLKPSTKAVGNLTNPNAGCRAVVYGDQGFLKIFGGDTGRATVPVGQWKLLNYTIDRTGFGQGATTAGQGGSLLETLADAIVKSEASTPGRTLVSARAPGDYRAVTVREGQTAQLPFGPPYKPVVKASPGGSNTAYLSMSLVGSGGEFCSNLVVDGKRPAAPEFTITEPSGKEISRGKFEYG